MKKVLVITGNGIALERFAREQRLRFKKEGFGVTIGFPSVPVSDTKAAPAADVKDAPAEEEKKVKKSNKK